MDPEAFTVHIVDGKEVVVRNPDYITEWVYHPRGVILGAAGVLKEVQADVDREIEGILGQKDTTEFPRDA